MEWVDLWSPSVSPSYTLSLNLWICESTISSFHNWPTSLSSKKNVLNNIFKKYLILKTHHWRVKTDQMSIISVFTPKVENSICQIRLVLSPESPSTLVKVMQPPRYSTAASVHPKHKSGQEWKILKENQRGTEDTKCQLLYVSSSVNSLNMFFFLQTI